MKTIYRILLPMLAACTIMLAGGCTEQFDTPSAQVATTDADIIGAGYEIVSIKTIKQIFEAEKPDYTYSNASFNFGLPIDGKSLVKAGMDANRQMFIKGRVISTDYFGNVYRTLYLMDASELPEGEEPEVIEVKIGLSGMFADYQPGDIVYVKTNGLTIGNYRFNLSLGSAFEALEGANEYANGYIDLKVDIEDRIKVGARNSELPPVDTLVIRAGDPRLNDFNIMDAGGRNIDPAKAKNIDKYVGRLVRFEGMTSVDGPAESGTPGFSDTDIYPSFLQQVGSGANSVYTNYLFKNVIAEWQAYEANTSVNEMPTSPRPGKMFPTWAFNGTMPDGQKASYYGSALFNVTGTSSYFVIRSSGYSNFSLEPLPFDYEITRDSEGNIINVEVTGNKEVKSVTGIVTRYASSSGGFHKFQILLNSSRDVVYDRSENPS